MFFIINKNGVIKHSTNQTQMTGEKVPGDLDSWNHFSTDPNVILRYSYNLLSERSVTLYHTHPPVASAIEKHVQYAIGAGLVFRSQPDWEILGMTKPQAKAWGMQLQKLIHYAFLILNFYEKQGIIFRTALVQGDSLLMFDRTEPPEGLPFDLIETGGDQIDWEKDLETTGDRQIRLGIETDKFLRRKGIWQHGATAMIPYIDKNSGLQNVIQFFERKIARQLRGYPLAYRVIAAAKNNDRLWDAMLNRMALEASIFGFEEGDTNDINRQAEKLAEDMRRAQNQDVVGSNPSSSLTTEGNIKNLGTGNIFSLAKGGKFNPLEMKTPSSNFTAGQEAYYVLIGMATNTPPEVVKSLYGGSYTAHMGALNDFEKAYMKERTLFYNIVNYPIVRDLAKFFIANGMLDMPNPQFFSNPIIQRAALAGKYLGPIPGVINPTDQANANETKVKNAFMLRSDAAMMESNEWDNFIEEWAEEESQWQESSPEYKAQKLQQEIDAEKEAAAAENEEENGGDDNNSDETNDENNNTQNETEENE